MNISENKIRTGRNALLFACFSIPLSLGLAHFILYSLDPNSIWWDFYKETTYWVEIFVSIFTGILMYAILFGIVNFLSRWVSRKALFKNNLLVHFLLTTIVVVSAMSLLIYLEDLFYDWFCTYNVPPGPELERAFRSYVIVNLVVAAFINSFYNAYVFFERWKADITELNKLTILSHELKETALQSELEVLKLQLDPHFLFNNFSTLTQLIQTNKTDAQLFLSHLSRVYRYVLASSKKNITTLEEEMKFVQSYFHLIKIRQGAAIELYTALNPTDLKKGIPPVTLQLLIENAIKHNISTIKQPLKIFIESSADGFILVRNNLQLMKIAYKGTGLGLSNIRKRYELLSGSTPEIRDTATSFEVRLPLLNF